MAGTVNLDNVKKVNIKEVAEIERAKAKKQYPAGVTQIVLSAACGRTAKVVFNEKGGEIEDGWAVVIPKEGVEPRYLFLAIEREFIPYFNRTVSGINYPFGEILKFNFTMHAEYGAQKAIADLMGGIEEQIERERRAIEEIKDVKRYHLSKMFV